MPPAFQHVEGNAEQDEAPGDLKGRQADAKETEDETANNHKQAQDDEGIEAGPPGQPPARLGRKLPGQGQIREEIPRGINDNKQGNQAGDEKGPDGPQNFVHYDHLRIEG